jgi:hypothetical protein
VALVAAQLTPGQSSGSTVPYVADQNGTPNRKLFPARMRGDPRIPPRGPLARGAEWVSGRRMAPRSIPLVKAPSTGAPGAPWIASGRAALSDGLGGRRRSSGQPAANSRTRSDGHDVFRELRLPRARAFRTAQRLGTRTQATRCQDSRRRPKWRRGRGLRRATQRSGFTALSGFIASQTRRWRSTSSLS